MPTVITNPGGTVKLAQAASAIAAGGLTIYSPATGKIAKLLSFSSDTTCTATVGNRVLQVRAVATVTGLPMWVGAASGNVTAAQVGGYDVAFGGAGAPSTTVRRNRADTNNTNVQVREFAPEIWLRAGDSFTIDDSANIDATDSCNHTLVYVEYDV